MERFLAPSSDYIGAEAIRGLVLSKSAATDHDCESRNVVQKKIGERERLR